VVVEGEVTQSFLPRYPQHLMHFSTVKDMLTNSQRDFLALELPSPQASLDPQQEIARDPLQAGDGRSRRDSARSRLHVLT